MKEILIMAERKIKDIPEIQNITLSELLNNYKIETIKHITK